MEGARPRNRAGRKAPARRTRITCAAARKNHIVHTRTPSAGPRALPVSWGGRAAARMTGETNIPRNHGSVKPSPREFRPERRFPAPESFRF